jgi:hypothetical protein
MAKLLTHHDPYHIHAVFGLLALCNYLWRIARWHVTGVAFPGEPGELLCVLIHGILPALSLFLHVPKQRNETKPMIWPEFRMHSIIFAWRHVLGTSATVLGLWPEGLAARIAAKYGLVLATTAAADFATKKLGNAALRTTNAMPYPDWVSAEMQIPIKDRYVAAQFAATAMSTYSRDDGYTAFIPLIGIQSAAFCMTLVRKHKLSEAGYHMIYSFSLALAGPWTLLYWDLTRGNDHFGLGVIVAMMVVMPLRLNCRKLPKELLWLVGVIIIELLFFLTRDMQLNFKTLMASPASPGDAPKSPPVVMKALGVLLKLGFFGWYVAPYSILVCGPESLLVRVVYRLGGFAAMYKRTHNEKRSKAEPDSVKDRETENTSPDTKMTENNEGSTTDSDSPRQMGAVSTQTSKRNLSNDTNRASETS